MLVIFTLIAGVIIIALCRPKWDKKEDFKGYLYCDDDCYMCGDLERCKRAVKKEGLN